MSATPAQSVNRDFAIGAARAFGGAEVHHRLGAFKSIKESPGVGTKRVAFGLMR